MIIKNSYDEKWENNLYLKSNHYCIHDYNWSHDMDHRIFKRYNRLMRKTGFITSDFTARDYKQEMIDIKKIMDFSDD